MSRHKKELCIIHIGMPKTGSSALQNSLFHKIYDKRVSYANLPIPNHSKIIYSLFATNPEENNYHQKRNMGREEIERQNTKYKKLLLEGFTNDTSSIEVISGEGIIHIDPDGLYRMKTFLEPYFEKIVVAGYVRPPKSFIESAFQQRVKYHELNSFDFTPVFPKYMKKLKKFDRVFGRKNVKLWKFDPKSFPNFDIVLDFYHRFGFEVNPEYQTQRSNDAISREATSLLYVNNKYVTPVYAVALELQINRVLVEKVAEIGKTKLRFSRTLFEDLMQSNKMSIEWVEDRLNSSMMETYEELESDIKCERDLVSFSKDTVMALQTIVFGHDSPKNFSTDIEYVVFLLESLKKQIANELIQSRLTNEQ